jgi:alpha-beta hydrolase superfamily lysophospholipase
MNGSGEQFQPLPGRIPGYAFHALDLRGQGSDHMAVRRGAALDFEQQMLDIAAFITALRKLHEGRPVFLMGESMGSLLAAGFVGWSRKNADTCHAVDGVILSVPVVGLRRAVPGFVRWILRCAAGIAPRAKLTPSRFVNGKRIAPPLTRDRAYQDSLSEKPHHISGFSLRFLVELGDLIEDSASLAEGIHDPTLVLAAGQDCFVKPDQIESWFEKIPARDKSLRHYPEAYHLLWHDWDRELVVSDIRAWLDQRTRH